MTELDILIGSRLQTARKALGFKSARSFARKHGIPESTYSQHETGKRSLNPTTLVNYCEKLKVSPGWLISGENGPSKSEDHLDLNLMQAILTRELKGLLQPNAQLQFPKVFELCMTAYQQQAAQNRRAVKESI